jgi:hypothetical protein
MEKSEVIIGSMSKQFTAFANRFQGNTAYQMESRYKYADCHQQLKYAEAIVHTIEQQECLAGTGHGRLR